MIYHALPALLLPHGPVSRKTTPAGPHVLQQWQLLFDRGHYTFPGNAILAASAFFHAGRQLPETLCSQKRLYYAAAGLDLAVIPFTLMFVAPVNVELLQRAARARKGVAESRSASETGLKTLSDVDLVKWWGWLGAIRAVFPLVAIAMTIAAASTSIESDVAKLDSLSTESASLALGTALLIFMVVRFGQPAVQV